MVVVASFVEKLVLEDVLAVTSMVEDLLEVVSQCPSDDLQVQNAVFLNVMVAAPLVVHDL